MQQSDRTLLKVAEQVLRNFGSSKYVVVPRQELRPIPMISEVQPRLVSLMKGMCLVLKPAGWEVDSEGHSGLRRLSDFLRNHLPSDRTSMIDAVDFGRGFIHRLDTPSSGLILAATSLQGYCSLEWQMYTYQIVRDYVVLSHDGLPSDLQDVQHRILDTHIVMVSERGRPAQSFFRLLGSFRLEKLASLVAIRIRTGRRHQIRVHLQSCGCPSVADHRYGITAVFLKVVE